MYIVRDKKTKKIIHSNPAPLIQGLKGKDVYFKFDASTMEIGKTDLTTVPDDFEIGKDGLIIDAPKSDESDFKNTASDLQLKTISEQVKEGLITLPPTQKIIGKGLDEAIVEKSLEEQYKDGLLSINEPFEYLDKGEIKQRTLEEVVKGKLLKTLDQCYRAMKRLKTEIDLSIVSEFSPGMEMKITKGYLDWLKEKQPDNDPREKAYNEMQERIDAIKKELNPIKEQLKQLQIELEKKIR